MMFYIKMHTNIGTNIGKYNNPPFATEVGIK